MDRFGEERRRFLKKLFKGGVVLGAGVVGAACAWRILEDGAGRGESESKVEKVVDTSELMGIPIDKTRKSIVVEEHEYFINNEPVSGRELSADRADQLEIEVTLLTPGGGKSDVVRVGVSGEYRGREVVSGTCTLVYLDGREEVIHVPEEVEDWYDERNRKGEFFAVPKEIRIERGTVNAVGTDRNAYELERGEVNLKTRKDGDEDLTVHIPWRTNARG